MITAFLELHHGFTAVASLPACFLSYLYKLLGGFVLRTFFLDMPFAITKEAHLSLATDTFSVLSSDGCI
jgi:hypothetical protein